VSTTPAIKEKNFHDRYLQNILILTLKLRCFFLMVVLLPAAVCLSDGAHPFKHQLVGLHHQFLQTIQALKVEAYMYIKSVAGQKPNS
jgi:hypothetical protein